MVYFPLGGGNIGGQEPHRGFLGGIEAVRAIKVGGDVRHIGLRVATEAHELVGHNGFSAVVQAHQTHGDISLHGSAVKATAPAFGVFARALGRQAKPAIAPGGACVLQLAHRLPDQTMGGIAQHRDAAHPAQPGTQQRHFEQAALAPEIDLQADGPFGDYRQYKVPVAGVWVDDKHALQSRQAVKVQLPTQCPQ
jgi:hypothetical protein